jgi:hypothetical protein
LRLAVSWRAAGLAVAVTMLLVAACGSSPGPTRSPAAVGSAAAPSPSLVTSPPTGASPSASIPTQSVLGVEVDPGLLAFVPGGGNGLDFTFDPDTTATVAADASLAGDLVGLAVGLYRVSGSAADDPNFAIVNVAHLRDASVGEAWFRDWRDTYDAAACAQAGGIQGHAQSEIGGRTVYIGSCAGGALTYHVRMGQGAIVVSLTSFGPMRLGEKVVKAIEP